MHFAKIVTLLIIFGVVNCYAKVYKDPSGNMTSTKRTERNKIIVGKGMKIIVTITRLDIGTDGVLTVTDGRVTSYSYKKSGLDVYIFQSNGSRNKVLMPIKIQSQTRKLTILKRGSGRIDLRYTSYPDSAPTSCDKSLIAGTYDNGVKITCNSDDLNPVASQFRVTLLCPINYEQFGKTVFCEDNNWEGLVRCEPRKNILMRCNFDFERNRLISSCPFSTAEIVQYYLDVERVDIFEPGLGRRVKCFSTCYHDDMTRRVVDCDNGNDMKQHVLCIICLVMYNCDVLVIDF